MIAVKKIKEAIDSLPEQEYIKLRQWFSEKDWKKWDKTIEMDSEEGSLDFLIEEAINEKNNGTLRSL